MRTQEREEAKEHMCHVNKFQALNSMRPYKEDMVTVKADSGSLKRWDDTDEGW